MMKRFFIGIATALFTYLATAFIVADIDFAHWSTDGRFWMVIVAAVFILVIMILYEDTPPQIDQKTLHRPKPPTKPPVSRSK